MIIDTHSHLNFKAYDADREEVLKRNLEKGVVCIDVGTKYETSKKAVELATQNENIFSAIGLHPIHIKTDLLKLRTDEDEGDFAPLGEELDIEKYRELAKNKKVVAIGEVGLDYYYRPKTKSRLEGFKKLQKEVFEKQLDLAVQLNLPVIVHCRMSHDDTIEILSKRNLKGVIHCFTGTWHQAQKYLDMGFYLGINGIIFKFDIDETIKNAPLEKLLTETDCPYLTPPQEGRDVRNEPIFVKHVIAKISDLRGMPPEEVSSQTYKNAKELFNI
jgi:TatD DNase family protein